MKNLILFQFLFICSFLFSQNLVKNPLFEIYNFLPEAGMDYNEEFSDSFACVNWCKIKYTTPDYFHVNSPDESYSIPINKFGYHPSISGNSYVGFIPFDLTGAIEPILGELTTALVKGKMYEISFYYRFAIDDSYFRLSRIDCYLSAEKDWFRKNYDAITDYEDIMIPNIKANVIFDDSIINDGKWHKHKGFYVASGNEKYLAIGVFYINKKIIKLVQQYLGNNIEFGDKDYYEDKLLKKYRKVLFIQKNISYSDEKQNALEISYKTKDTTNIYKPQQRYPYYFIDRIEVVEKNR